MNETIVRILGGDVQTFLRDHWRQRPLYVPGAVSDLEGSYDVEAFLADLATTLSKPYVCVKTRDGNRIFSEHDTIEGLRGGVEEGGVCAVKMSRYWHGDVPESWMWMRSLFGDLCRAVAMTYMQPARSEDVDIFLAGPRSTLGAHFDTTDVFTVQLAGERSWKVEEDLHLDQILALASDPSWYPAKELSFERSTREVTLRPGDVLYVPAHAIHSVTGVTWSVSLSLGLRAFNEIDLVEHVLERIRMTSYMSHAPAPSLPESAGEAHIEAKLDLMGRVRQLLAQVEAATAGVLMAPLQLPAALEPVADKTDLASDSPPILGMFTSGFALHDEQ